jgi:hydroxymethylglutaryl-CoA lyase
MDFAKVPKELKIVEVGPRDGLQNEKESLSTDDKYEYILKLLESGLTSLEVTSFVNPKAIAQMGDAAELFTKIKDNLNLNNYEFVCLVPNMKGYQTAKSLGVKHIALFSATSDEFTKKNINATVDESFKRMDEVALEAKKDGIKIRGYISTAFGCPYAGKMSSERLVEVIERFKAYDVYELSIGDTIGVATPKQVDQYLDEMLKVFDVKKLAMHFHDTRGMALSNILVSLSKGISIFDASSGGLGGCPYAKGATGNVATEDLLYLAKSFNILTGVDMDKLSQASEFILSKVNKETPSKFLKAYLNAGRNS